MSSDCVARVYFGGRGSSHRCRNSVTVERDGKYYCGTHDPEAVARRDQKRDERIRAQIAADSRRSDIKLQRQRVLAAAIDAAKDGRGAPEVLDAYAALVKLESEE